MHHLKQQWWKLELRKFLASWSRFEIPLHCILLNDANSICIFNQNMRTPGNKLVWLMQFIVNNNQKYYIDISYWMELLSHLQTQYNTNSRTYLVNVIRKKHRPNIVNKLFPTCGASLRTMNTTDNLEISYPKTNNTINVFFEMYEVEGAWLLFQFKKNWKKLTLGWIPSFWFPLAPETTCVTDMCTFTST